MLSMVGIRQLRLTTASARHVALRARAPPPEPISSDVSATWLARVMGSSSLEGKRVSSGEVLEMIDMVAARAAHRHCGVTNIATVSIDRIDLSVPIVHGDLLHMDARVVKAGRSTVTVEVRGKKKDSTREWRPSHTAHLVFAALNERGRPIRMPGVAHADSTESDKYLQMQKERMRLNSEWRKEKDLVQRASEEGLLSKLEVQDENNKSMKGYLKIDDTTVRLRESFMPGDVNHVGSIFGGSILSWMERAAKCCAVHFTNNNEMVTIGIDRLDFKQAIFPTDLLELRARVTYHAKNSVQVEVSVEIIRPIVKGPTLCEENRIYSHTGSFRVVNLNQLGLQRRVLTGIDLENASQEELATFEIGKRRHHFWKNTYLPWIKSGWAGLEEHRK